MLLGKQADSSRNPHAPTVWAPHPPRQSSPTTAHDRRHGKLRSNHNCDNCPTAVHQEPQRTTHVQTLWRGDGIVSIDFEAALGLVQVIAGQSASCDGPCRGV